MLTVFTLRGEHPMLKRLWKTHAPLTATGLLMLPALAIAAVGLFVDPLLIMGSPAWLKPAKFALSIAVYVFTLAWTFTFSTPLNAALFAVMGTAIVLQTVTSIAIAIALWRQEFEDHALGWALRLGMIITIVGAFSGGLMTHPTADQLAAAHAGQAMPVIGAHTVGAPDGGAGIP